MLLKNFLLMSSALLMTFQVNASLIKIDEPENYEKLFFTEVKVDENLLNGKTGGKDVFLTYGDQSGNNQNSDLFWKNIGDVSNFSHTFDWSLSKVGNVTTFNFGNIALQHQSLDGNWNALGFWMNANGRNDMFTSSSLSIDIDDLTLNASLGNRNMFYLQNANGNSFENISGTATFSWEMNPNYSGNGSPNSSMMFSIKGLDVSEVPAPSSFALSCLMIAGLLVQAKRKKTLV
jgi:hypothetical protein